MEFRGFLKMLSRILKILDLKNIIYYFEFLKLFEFFSLSD